MENAYENELIKDEINEERIRLLKGNYQKPEVHEILFTDQVQNNCSDMQSVAYCCEAAEIVEIDRLPLESAFALN